jgi:hypothetical protein
LPRRIEYHRIELFEFSPREGAAKQVARLRCDRLEAQCSRHGLP